ncbi:hypothetical protein AMST5_01496 [freshwater sediment metagenome]|uniref:DUF1622 domain-containing protein n=1 Tax=freshwater sediment metagenome TaxID=556182 RepID=A0AA48LYI3_9ZZZZ
MQGLKRLKLTRLTPFFRRRTLAQTGPWVKKRLMNVFVLNLPTRAELNPALTQISTLIEAAGVMTIVIAALVATLSFLFGGLSSGDWQGALRLYRANLGRGILLGLELLVAADIIGTVAVTPSLANLAVLGGIVLIRTFLSFSLEVEIEGRWPWARLAAPREEKPEQL